MHRCGFTKPNDQQCGVMVSNYGDLCFWHDQAQRERMLAVSSKGGKSQGSAEIREIKKQLQDVADKVLSGELDRAIGGTVAHILQVKLRAVEVERRVIKLEALEEELRSLLEGRGIS